MSEFWKNISRYPRFFVSSLVGSLLIILTPLKTLFKIPKFRGLFVLLIFFSIIILYITIRKMTGL